MVSRKRQNTTEPFTKFGRFLKEAPSKERRGRIVGEGVKVFNWYESDVL